MKLQGFGVVKGAMANLCPPKAALVCLGQIFPAQVPLFLQGCSQCGMPVLHVSYGPAAWQRHVTHADGAFVADCCRQQGCWHSSPTL